MTEPNKFIRDFIYVDVKRLYSFYSQVFEGVADQIVQSYIDASATSDSQKSSLLKGSSIEAQVAEISRRTENTFLYDHMYNLFENKIQNAILETPSSTADKYQDILSNAFMVKVSGAAEIEDYSRLNIVMEKYNEIGKAIAHAGMTAEEVEEAVEVFDKAISQLPDRNQRAKAKQKAAKFTNRDALVEQRAKDLGLYQNEQTLKNLKMFSELFQ